MAELADALDSGSSEVTLIQVQVLLSAPQKESFGRKVGAFLFVPERSGLEPFQAPAIRTTKKKASIVRSELFFLSWGGQDLNLFKLLLSAPQKESFNRKVGAFLFVLGWSGLEPFQAPAIRTTKKKASAVRSELFFLSRLVDTPPAPSNLYRSTGLVACGPVFVSSRSCRNLDLPACSPVQHPRPIVGDGVKRTVFIHVVALPRQLANRRKISRIV